MPYQFKRSPLTREESNALSNACETLEEKMIVWTLLDTGLRVAELAKLTAVNFDWQGHRVTVSGKGGPYGKLSKIRVVPLSARVRALLEPAIAAQGSIGVSVRTEQRIVARVANRARILRPCSPHVLRHTFAVEWIRKNGSLPALQRLLGHDRLSVTEAYLNLSPEDVLREFHEKW